MTTRPDSCRRSRIHCRLLERRRIGRKVAQEIDGGIRAALAESGDELAQFVSPEPPLADRVTHLGDPCRRVVDERAKREDAAQKVPV